MELNTTEIAFDQGQIIAERYEVVKVLGSGGMGVVILAIDRALYSEPVALKLLHTQLVKDKVAFDRFRNEILVVRKLSHPNIIKIYDFGNAGRGIYFLSMEYIAGENLGTRIHERFNDVMPFQEILRILFEVSQALSHAHRKGIIHRDLKPDNVLIGETGNICVTDFGLARSSDHSFSLTPTGEAVGTPYYMAPEQIRGEKSDTRSDIYSMGIMAYEMIVGMRPFYGDTWFNLARKHFTEPLPEIPEELEVPIWFDDFIRTCAAKDKEDRYASCDEVASVLFEHMNSESRSHCQVPTMFTSTPISVRQPKSRWRTERQKATTIKAIKASVLLVVLVLVLLGTLNFVMPIHSVVATLLLRTEKKLGWELLPLKSLIGCDLKADEDHFLSALERENVSELKILISSGMDPKDLSPKSQSLAMHLAIESGNEQITELLIRSRFELDSKDENSITPLIKAVSLGGRNRLVEMLIQAGASPYAQDNKKLNAIAHAVIKQDLNVAKTLLSFGSTQSVRDSSEKIPLMYAAENGDVAMVQLLLTGPGNALVNASDKTGMTPLMYAVLSKNVSRDIFRILLKAGADPEQKNSKGNTAFDIARRIGKKNNSTLFYDLRAVSEETLKNPNSLAVENNYTLASDSKQDSKTIQWSKTALMIVGEPVLEFWPNNNNRDSLVTTRNAQVTIRNRGEVAAHDVRVWLVFPNGREIELKGAEKLERNAYQVFRGDLNLKIPAGIHPNVKFTCSNCY